MSLIRNTVFDVRPIQQRRPFGLRKLACFLRDDPPPPTPSPSPQSPRPAFVTPPSRCTPRNETHWLPPMVLTCRQSTFIRERQQKAAGVRPPPRLLISQFIPNCVDARFGCWVVAAELLAPASASVPRTVHPGLCSALVPTCPAAPMAWRTRSPKHRRR